PVEAVSVWLYCAVPVIAGSAVFVGAASAVTTAVCADVAEAEPTALVAVTTTRSVRPTSLAFTTYVEEVAPPIGEHVAVQLCHWYANEVGLPVQVPVDAV